MARGGKRPRAGRKKGRNLDVRQRMRIGARCESLWNNAIKLNEEAAQMVAVPPDLTEVWKRNRKMAKEFKKMHAKEREEWKKIMAFDVEIELRAAQNIPDDDMPSRILSVAVKKPYAILTKVRQRVAADFGVSLRTVESCHKEFRALTKNSPEDENY